MCFFSSVTNFNDIIGNFFSRNCHSIQHLTLEESIIKENPFLDNFFHFYINLSFLQNLNINITLSFQTLQFFAPHAKRLKFLTFSAKTLKTDEVAIILKMFQSDSLDSLGIEDIASSREIKVEVSTARVNTNNLAGNNMIELDFKTLPKLHSLILLTKNRQLKIASQSFESSWPQITFLSLFFYYFSFFRFLSNYFPNLATFSLCCKKLGLHEYCLLLSKLTNLWAPFLRRLIMKVAHKK